MFDKNTELKKEIVYYAKLLDEKGLVNTLEGNLSILDRETGKMYITPSGTRKRFLNEDKIAVVKDAEQIEGTVKKSSEILLHEAALKARPDCNAAAHPCSLSNRLRLLWKRYQIKMFYNIFSCF